MVRNTKAIRLFFVALIIVTVKCTLVTKHNPRTAQTDIRSQKGPHNDIVNEKYISGICKEGQDDFTLYNQSYGQCITECKSRSQCSAINFYMKLGVCRLNFRTDLTDKSCPKYILSEKKNWRQKSIPGCEKKKCPNTHKCKISKGNPVCVATGCENVHSIENGVVYGNRVEIGENRGFRCDKGYNLIGSRKITCLVDGKWSDEVPICQAHKTTTQSAVRMPSQLTTTTNSSQRPTTKPSTTASQTNKIEAVANETETQVNQTDSPVYKTSIIQNSTENTFISRDHLWNTHTSQASTPWTYTAIMISSKIGMSTNTAVGTSSGAMYNQFCNGKDKTCLEEYQECRRNRCRCSFAFAYDYTKAMCVQAKVPGNDESGGLNFNKLSTESSSMPGNKTSIDLETNDNVNETDKDKSTSTVPGPHQDSITDRKTIIPINNSRSASYAGKTETTALSVPTILTFTTTMKTSSASNTSSEIAHFISPPMCSLGTIYSYKYGRCYERECYVFENTYQQHKRTTIQVGKEGVIEEMDNLFECLFICISIPECSIVVEFRLQEGAIECYLLNTKGLPSLEEFSQEQRGTLYMRDCV